jgi:hypothetical protein
LSRRRRRRTRLEPLRLVLRLCFLPLERLARYLGRLELSFQGLDLLLQLFHLGLELTLSRLQLGLLSGDGSRQAVLERSIQLGLFLLNGLLDVHARCSCWLFACGGCRLRSRGVELLGVCSSQFRLARSDGSPDLFVNGGLRGRFTRRTAFS